MKAKLNILALWVLSSLTNAPISIAGTNAPPNIVYILADDLGYGDLGCYGQKTLKTPNIDRLAKEGMRFTQHYSGSTVCAPSRSTLMEGRHTGHCSVRGNQPPQLTDRSLKLLPAVLRDGGYATGIVGKWGVGDPPLPDDPLRCGFDYAYGYVNMWHAHNFFPEFLYRNGVKETLPGNKLDPAYPFPKLPEGTGVAKDRAIFAPDLIERDALDFIRRNQSRRFFLFISLNLPHNNGEAAQALGDGCEVPDYGEFAGRDWPVVERGFARMSQFVDLTVGRVMEQLKKLGLEENTLLLFSSDNGAYGGGNHDVEFFDSNGALRGYKRDLYEGGIRVPLIVRWPGRVAAGSTNDHVSAMWDLFPTFCDVAGSGSPSGLDGISMLPTLLSRKEQKQHEALYWEFHEQGGSQAVRQGNWKAVRTHIKDSQPEQFELFNLAADPGEKMDLAGQHPEIARRLREWMTRSRQPHPSLNFKNP